MKSAEERPGTVLYFPAVCFACFLLGVFVFDGEGGGGGVYVGKTGRTSLTGREQGQTRLSAG